MSFNNRILPEIDRSRCVGCRKCVDMCPARALDMVEDKATMARPDDCIYCTDCEVICSARAIRCPFLIVMEKAD